MSGQGKWKRSYSRHILAKKKNSGIDFKFYEKKKQVGYKVTSDLDLEITSTETTAFKF